MRSALLLAVAVLLPAVAAAEPEAQRQGELRHLLLHDCGSCHGLSMKGGLGAPLLPSALAEKSDAALVHVILEGVPGTPMPPWRAELTPAEAAWLVRELRKGGDAR